MLTQDLEPEPEPGLGPLPGPGPWPGLGPLPGSGPGPGPGRAHGDDDFLLFRSWTAAVVCL